MKHIIKVTNPIGTVKIEAEIEFNTPTDVFDFTNLLSKHGAKIHYADFSIGGFEDA